MTAITPPDRFSGRLVEGCLAPRLLVHSGSVNTRIGPGIFDVQIPSNKEIWRLTHGRMLWLLRGITSVWPALNRISGSGQQVRSQQVAMVHRGRAKVRGPS